MEPVTRPVNAQTKEVLQVEIVPQGMFNFMMDTQPARCFFLCVGCLEEVATGFTHLKEKNVVKKLGKKKSMFFENIVFLFKSYIVFFLCKGILLCVPIIYIAW
jgi:hypothetical protein